MELGIYRTMILDFLEGRLEPRQFADRYVQTFGRDQEMRPEEEFRILNGVFIDAEAYSEVVTHKWDVTRQEMVSGCQAALARIDHLLASRRE